MDIGIYRATFGNHHYRCLRLGNRLSSKKLVFDIEMAWITVSRRDDVADCPSYADIADTVINHVEAAFLLWSRRGGRGGGFAAEADSPSVGSRASN